MTLAGKNPQAGQVQAVMNRERWDDPLHAAISQEKVQQIAGKVLADERVLKSVLRQTEYRRIGVLHFEEGASKDTVAFSSVRDMILKTLQKEGFNL